jgi:ubiquinone/menaquinone biosynthesis C-methylase UbiE
MTAHDAEGYLPALAYRFLTPLYDPLVRVTTREGTFKDTLIEQAGIEAGMRVLDVGSGTGTLAIRIKERCPGALVGGLDGDPEMLGRARAKAERAGVSVEFSEGLSYELPYEDESFDRVVSSLLFHHLLPADKVRTLAEIRRVLRPGGELHVADWGRPSDPLMRVAATGIRLLDGAEPTAQNLSGCLPQVIAEAGFEQVSEGRGYRTAFGLLRLVRSVRP